MNTIVKRDDANRWTLVAAIGDDYELRFFYASAFHLHSTFLKANGAWTLVCFDLGYKATVPKDLHSIDPVNEYNYVNCHVTKSPWP